MQQLITVIQFFRDLGVNIPAVLGALLATRFLIKLLETIFSGKEKALDMIDKFKPEIPVFISLVICVVFFLLGETTISEFIAESLLSGFAAAFLYSTIKRKLEKGVIDED
jgi:hypothetical protein